MTKEEFIGHAKGVITSQIVEGVTLTGPLQLIKDALDNITPEPITYMQEVTNVNTNTEMIPYHELCSCNPKNGGSGICGCIMGNKLVPKNSWSTSNTTANSNPNFNNPTNEKI